VNKLVNLCDKILDNIAESRAAETDAENKRIAQYKLDVVSLEGSIAKFKGKIVNQEALIKSQNSLLKYARS